MLVEGICGPKYLAVINAIIKVKFNCNGIASAEIKYFRLPKYITPGFPAYAGINFRLGLI